MDKSQRNFRPIERLRLRLDYLMTTDDLTTIARRFGTTKQTVSRNTSTKGLSRGGTTFDLLPQVIRLWELWSVETRNLGLIEPDELAIILLAFAIARGYPNVERVRDVIPRLREWIAGIRHAKLGGTASTFSAPL